MKFVVAVMNLLHKNAKKMMSSAQKRKKIHENKSKNPSFYRELWLK